MEQEKKEHAAEFAIQVTVKRRPFKAGAELSPTVNALTVLIDTTGSDAERIHIELIDHCGGAAIY